MNIFRNLLILGFMLSSVSSLADNVYKDCSIGQVTSGDPQLPGENLLIQCESPRLQKTIAVCEDAQSKLAPVILIARLTGAKAQKILDTRPTV